MMNARPADAMQEYRQVSLAHEVENANPHRLIQMMMEQVLSKIAIARGHMERKSVSEKGSNIGDAIGLINGLQVSLNHKANASLSSNFDALYDYMSRRLLEANLNNDPGILEEVAGLMRELKSAWDAIGDQIDAKELATSAK